MKKLIFCLGVVIAGCASTGTFNDPVAGKEEYKQGATFLHGEGVSKDPKAAEAWFVKSAEHGNADGQYALGWMYMAGESLPVDEQMAEKWFKASANQGNALAQDQLGKLSHNHGRYVESVYWLSKAAKQGLADAQFGLGLIYSRGEKGVNGDPEAARVWLRKAAAQGYEPAKKLLAELPKMKAECGSISEAFNPGFSPQKNCVYSSNPQEGLTVEQVTPAGVLVSPFGMNEHLVFVEIPKGTGNLVDGAALPSGRYVSAGPLTYDSLFGRRTVHSFRPI